MKNLFSILLASIICLLVYSKISATQAKASPELLEWQESAEIFTFKNHKISYHDSRTIDKPVIILMHGYPTSSWDWRFVWKELKSDYRLVTLDMLGFGFSDKPRELRYSIFEQADIYQSLLAFLSVDAAHIVAHDYGDIVVQEFLARQTKSKGFTMKSLVLLNGGIFPEAHEAVFIQKLLDSRIGRILSQFSSRAIFGKSLAAVFGDFTRPTKLALDDYWFLSVYNNGHTLNHKLLHYLDDRFVHRDRWVGAMLRTKVPMLFINGLADPVSGVAMVNRYVELMPDPKVVRLYGVGHFPHVEAPQAVIAAIQKFIGPN